MASEALWDSARPIVLKMKSLIQTGSAERIRKSQLGWQYHLLEQCKAMKADIEARRYEVHDCIVFHFALGAKIENPTRRLLLIPIQGISNLTPNEALLGDLYWDIKDGAEHILVPDQDSGADIVVITLIEKRECES